MSQQPPPQKFIDLAESFNDEQAAAVVKALKFIDDEAPFVVKQNLDNLMEALELIDEEEE
jgi:hypothetical protein